MFRRSIAIAITSALSAAACGYSGGYPPDAGPHITPDAMPPPWWSPHTGDAKNWDIQLAAPIDTSAARTMYVLDLWSLVPSATTIDYGDNDPVSVPAGSLATTIATLHATTPKTIVICRIDTGALELARPDARKFPGWSAGLTTCPTTTASGPIGFAATAPDECYLDTSPTGAKAWSAIMFKRFDLAKQIGCDGIVGDRNDHYGATTGFADPTLSDVVAWYASVGAQTHQRKLSAGMKDAYEIAGALDQLAADFDWLLVQGCGEAEDCDTTRDFYNMEKDVLAIDYDPNPDSTAPALMCSRQQDGLVQSGLIKDPALDSKLRTQCTP